MATKKTQQVEVEQAVAEAIAEEAAAAEPEKETDIWDEMVSLFVPRARKGEEENAYVCVNDRRFSIPRNGKTQEMPRPIAEILQASFEAQAAAEDFAENMNNREPTNGIR